MGTKPNLNAKSFNSNSIFAPIFHFPAPCARSRSLFPVLVTSVKFYLVFLVNIGGYCSLQSEELEIGNCQSLVNGTSSPYYAMECYDKGLSEKRKCLSTWCSLIASCFNETSNWKRLCYWKFYWLWPANFDISTATKDINVSNVRNIHIKNCGLKKSRRRFKIQATGYRCPSKTAQRGTYAEIKHCMCYEVIRVS